MVDPRADRCHARRVHECGRSRGRCADADPDRAGGRRPALRAAARSAVDGDQRPCPRRGCGEQTLSNRIGEALARNGDSTPNAQLTRKKAAGDQVKVSWVLGLTYPDPSARTRVRVDILSVLDLVQKSGVQYGSVLLLATGVSVEKGKKKVSVVVRAKYTQALVRRTDWTTVSPNDVLGMCDDKPAVVAAGYR